MSGLLSPKLDIIFKAILATPGDNSFITDFLAAVLDVENEDLKNLNIINGEITPDFFDEKFARLDIAVEIKDMKADIEMQSISNKYYNDRALFYWARLFTKGFERGSTYDKLENAISINVIDFDMFGYGDTDTSYHSVFRLREDYHRDIILTDKCRLDFLELPRANKIVKGDKQLKRIERWMKFFNISTEEDAEMIAKTDGIMNSAVQRLKIISADDNFKEWSRLREKQMHDEATYLKIAKEEGRAEGITEGRAEGRTNTIKELYNNGMSIEQISKFLKISIDDLTQILSQ